MPPGAGENQLARIVSSFELTRHQDIKEDSLEKQGIDYFENKDVIKLLKAEEKDHRAGVVAAKGSGFQVIELTFENITTGLVVD